jgi:phage/plasmid-like protein (TIGR03299 family)
MAERMFMKSPWDGLGKECKGTKKLDEVLAITNLNFTAQKQPMFLADGTEVKSKVANVRSDNGAIIGIVSPNYSIIQNREAFEFLDGLVDNGMEFVRGGATTDGASGWILGKLEGYKLFEEDITPYLMFRNSFDGSSGVKVSVCMLRQICENGLTLRIPHNDFSWNIRHTKNAVNKFDEVKKTLINVGKYQSAFIEEMDVLAQTKLTSISDFTNFLLPNPMGAEVSARTLANLAEQRLAIEVLYNTKVDIMKYQMTAYGAYLALTDYLSHATPQRVTKGWEEKRMFNITDGHQLVDRAQEYFASIR